MSIVCYKMINFIYDIFCRIKDLKSKEMFYDEMQMLVFGLVFWLFWFGDDLLDLLKKSKKSDNSTKKSQRKIFITIKRIKYGCGKWMATYFPMKNFIYSKAAKSKILKIGSETKNPSIPLKT